MDKILNKQKETFFLDHHKTKFNQNPGPDPECNKKCANNGWCNHDKICQCLEGYMGQYCQTALCYPQCMNGGNCTAPGICSCPKGYQGRYCEGGKMMVYSFSTKRHLMDKKNRSIRKVGTAKAAKNMSGAQLPRFA